MINICGCLLKPQKMIAMTAIDSI